MVRTATMNIGPCMECGEPRHAERRCVKHYRFKQMQHEARVTGKLVPTVQQLEDLLAALDCLRCPICGRAMNWLAREGQATTLTLQHDRDGGLRLLCRSCNTRHSWYEGDSFYAVGPDRKRCPVCRELKPLTEFHRVTTDRYWGGRGGRCKPCNAKAQAAHRAKKKGRR